MLPSILNNQKQKEMPIFKKAWDVTRHKEILAVESHSQYQNFSSPSRLCFLEG